MACAHHHFAHSTASLSHLSSIHSHHPRTRTHARTPRSTPAAHALAQSQGDAPSVQSQGGTTVGYFVTCHPGLEEACEKEIMKLGIKRIRRGRAGVKFMGTVRDGYRAVLWSRTGIRVLSLLGEEMLNPGLDGAQGLYEFVRTCGVDWASYIPPGSTFSVSPHLRNCTNINSKRLVWQRVKDAICDAVSDARNERLQPPPPDQMADVPLYVTAFEDRVTIYRDLSGMSMHRRGYREKMHKSALNEAAAAAIITLSGWDDMLMNSQAGEPTLVDPMCGSATLLLEAAQMAHNRAPGLARPPHLWPLQAWPDFEPRTWEEAREEAADSAAPSWKGTLYGADVHKGALALAEHDIRRAGLSPGCIQLHNKNCATWQLPAPPSLIVTNPPWGLRLMGEEREKDAQEDVRRGRQPGSRLRSYQEAANPRQSSGMQLAGGPSDHKESADALERSWRALSTFLKSQCGDTSAYILSGNKYAFRHLWMKPSKKWSATLGGVEAQLHHYHVLPPKNGGRQ